MNQGPLFSLEDFSSKEGQERIINYLNWTMGKFRGVDEHLRDLTYASQEKLIQMGKAYAKPENLNFQ